MDKKSYIEKNLKNLSLIRDVDSSDSQVKYLCPLCMKPFSTDRLQSNLTEEDVPQASLGGHRITLTCRNCNSTCGSIIDFHLLNAINWLEQRAFLPGTNRKMFVESGDKRLNAILKVAENRELALNVDTNRTTHKYGNISMTTFC